MFFKIRAKFSIKARLIKVRRVIIRLFTSLQNFGLVFVLRKEKMEFSSEATAPLDIAETDARSSGKRYSF